VNTFVVLTNVRHELLSNFDTVKVLSVEQRLKFLNSCK